MASASVNITGLKEFQRGLKAMDRELPKALRMAFNEAADIVLDDARPDVPRRSGAAAGTLKSRSTQTSARVSGGSGRAPYYPWLDFGGRVGRRHQTRRPFLTKGRYIYPALDRNRAKFLEAMSDALEQVARRAGLEVG